jgi:hypothetical protein
MVSRKTNLSPEEWGSARRVFEKFCLTRGTLDKLEKAGRIKSSAIRVKEGSRKSVRLYSFASIRELLAENVRA